MRILLLNVHRKVLIASAIIVFILAPLQAANAQGKKDVFTDSVETTLFDVYLGDKLKGAILADYTDEWILISDPKDVIDQIKDLKNGEKLVPLLEGQIFKKRQIPELGNVHFNLNTFSIIIEVDPQFLSTTNLQLGRKVGDPENAPSLQQRVSVISSGSAQGESNSAFSHRGIASYGAFFAVADGAVVSDRQYELTQATGGGILGDYRMTGGLLQTQGNSFSPSLQYSGLKFETASELFLDQDLIRGSKLEVFVPSRSRVEFYRDGRLIAVQILEFGLREIDTTNFPQGSYDVDIVIIDSFGSSSRQRKFFTKAGFLTSRAKPIYSFQIGSIRDNLDTTETPVYQGGVRWRATDIFDLNASMYGSEDLSIGTLETLGLYRDLRFGFGYNQSSEDDSGITSNLGITVYGVNLSFTHTDTLQGGVIPAVEPPPSQKPFDPIFDLPSRSTSLLFQDRSANSYNISRRVGQFDFRYADEKVSGDGTPERFNKGPYIDWFPIENGTSTLRFHASKLDTDLGDVTTFGTLYAYRLSRNLTFAAQLAHQNKDQGDETVFLATLGYDEKDQNEVGTRGLFTSEIRNRKDPVNGGSLTSVNNQADLDLTGDMIQGVGFIRDSRTDGQDNTSYGISGSSSFLLASDGSVSISHPINRQAVFIGEVESNTTTSSFEILVDDQVVGTVKAGEQTVIGVTPYRTYDVKLRPLQGADLVTYESAASKMTVFPGNVIKRQWKVEKVFILLGRIIDEYGEPVARHRIKGTKEYTVTEEDGTFQAEIGGFETLTIESKSHRCTLKFDLPSSPEYFLDIGDIPCETVANPT